MNIQHLHKLLGLKVEATDGEVGTVHDFYITDDGWRVAYAVVATGSFFSGRHLVMPPETLQFQGDPPEVVRVSKSRNAILSCPDWDAERPVYRQKEEEIGQKYLWLPKGSLSNIVFRPLGAAEDELNVNEEKARAKGDNPHLRSLREIRGYEVVDRDGNPLGHLMDAVVDRDHWAVNMVCIKLPFEKAEDGAMVGIQHIDEIDWARATARVDLDPADMAMIPLDEQAYLAHAFAR